MNFTNLSYSEIQNLRIQADIETNKTGKYVSISDIQAKLLKSKAVDTVHTPQVMNNAQKPLPFYPVKDLLTPPKRNNVNKYIRLRCHQKPMNHNFFLVRDSRLVNPDKNIISIKSALGKILFDIELGETFTLNGFDYTVLDIFNKPQSTLDL